MPSAALVVAASSPALVNLGTAYSFSASGTYHGPPDGGREEALGYIETLPINPAPEAFGLHANADITKDLNDTELMLGSLLSMNGGGGGGGGGGASAADTDARVAAVVTQCLQTLPPPFDVEAVQKRFPVCYEESLNTVLVQEMARFNKLTGVIKDSLKAIDAALKGLLVMSSELEAAFRSLCINQVGVGVRER
jgi:dynein heavy chain